MQLSQTTTESANVGAAERLASVAAGAVLLTRLFRKRSVPSVVGAVIGADLLYRGISGHCHLYNAVGIDTAKKQKFGSEISESAPQVRRTITIGKSPQEVFDAWSDPQKLSVVMGHFAEVSPRSNGGSGLVHWRMKGPLNQVFEWDSQKTHEERGRSIAWESLPGTQLPNHGQVTFRSGPDGVGTEVTLQMQFEPPLGAAGARLVKSLSKIPQLVASKALRRFKSLVETGEIPSLASNPSARGSSDAF